MTKICRSCGCKEGDHGYPVEEGCCERPDIREVNQIWSYMHTDVDMLNDLRPYELLEMGPTGWWKTRDEAFFAMLAERAEQIAEDKAEEPEFEGYDADLASWLDYRNWREDKAGCLFYQDDFVIAYLVTGVIND